MLTSLDFSLFLSDLMEVVHRLNSDGRKPFYHVVHTFFFRYIPNC